ncbi:MAG: class I SAM-dependent methyltransferase [Leptolyngbyaceae bacterium]|nr:class I SAM-dependent methyltransferase [Leptolyngbyaceae bacterium]
MSQSVFLCPQLQHDLIPQAHSPEDDVPLVRETREFRASMFQLFQTKADDVIAAHPDASDEDQQSLKVRHVLDQCPEVMHIHERRGELQDRLWARVLEEIEGDRPRLEHIYRNHAAGKGGLDLNPSLDVPLHQRKTNIHRMPGGYLDDQFNTGVMYDHGTFLYGYGWFGPLNDELGHTLIHQVLNEHYPELQPQTILDLGCAVGHSTLPYASAFPEAKVHGVDLSASLLKYAIARARVLDQTVYFSQQNAENTEFSNQSFDLVVSHILFHEIPDVARQRIFAESYRLLKPGGVMVHLESKLFLNPPSIVSRYFRDTEVWANSEPYLGSSKFKDFPTYALNAGFAPDNFHARYVPGYSAAQNGDTTARWVAFCGVKR